MHQLSFDRLCALALVVGVTLLSGNATAAEPSVVKVLYAGSLVTPMEGPVKSALRVSGIDFQGQSGGSKALANLIASGESSPDVFIYVDPKLVEKFKDRVASTTTFAATSLGVAWTPSSRYAALFDRAAKGDMPLEDALETPELRIGRTDPKLDPKGQYTVAAVTAWLGSEGERRILGDDENPAQIFPEEDLLARVDTGQADIGFFYRTEAIARHYHFMPVPGDNAFTSGIRYTLAVMKDAPHPREAKTFADFILTGSGRAILERAGLTYL